jgi:hypothetical protein
MKKTILRILIRAILLSLISAISVTVTGLILRWKTSTQFSDGFFWAGVIIFGIGFINILGRLNQPMGPYNRSTFNLNSDERFKLWMADTFHGYNTIFFLGTSGSLLFGLASLVLRLF